MASFAEGLLGGARQFTGGMANLVNAGETLERRKRDREMAPILKEIAQNRAAQGRENLSQSQTRGGVLQRDLDLNFETRSEALSQSKLQGDYQEQSLKDAESLRGLSIEDAKTRQRYLDPTLSQGLEIGAQSLRRGEQQYEMGELALGEAQMRFEDLPDQYASAKKVRTVRDYQMDKQIDADKLEKLEGDIVGLLKGGRGGMTDKEKKQLEPLLREYAVQKGPAAASIINKFGKKEDAEGVLNYHLGKGKNGFINDDGSVTILDESFNRIDLPKN